MNSDQPHFDFEQQYHPDLSQAEGSWSGPILQIEHLMVYQGQHPAVQDVSFELQPGTDTAVVGPNGAGKSTLIQAILGLLPRKQGTIQIFGRPLSRLGNLRHQIGYVPQNFVFDRSFPISVHELVGLGWVDLQTSASPTATPIETWLRSLQTLASRGDRHQRRQSAIAQALQRVDAYHLRHRPIGTLSTGQLKRVLLAYCLVMPRKLLVLDEAFAGVDAQGEADFYALLHQLKQEQQWTVLQVSHDLDMVSRHCDRVLCVNQRLICHGQPEVALSPQNLLAAYGPAFSRYQHNH
ncbi:metal ABC transporter ATP-binding protein [Trichocoleus desertorum AS-A10]|uniref:metal ABC transporter ATP-binding protein n=1 Tax=Trichocoleus desertorum TaxID=1481672 RepID=UPI00329B3D13